MTQRLAIDRRAVTVIRKNFRLRFVKNRSGLTLVPARRPPRDRPFLLPYRAGLRGEHLASLFVPGLRFPLRTLHRSSFEFKRRQFTEGEIDHRYPGRPAGIDIEPGQHQKLARSRGGDVPETHPFPVEFGVLGFPDLIASERSDTQHRTEEAPARAIGDGAVRLPYLRHRVDRYDDRPLQPLGGVHGVERDRLLLGVRPALYRAGLFGPGRRHRFGEGAQPSHSVGAAEAEI